MEEALWGLPFAGANGEPKHGRREAIEGGNAPGEDMAAMAQDQEKVWTTSSLRSQASKHSLSWSIRDSIHLASYSKWKGDLARWKGKNGVCWFLVDQRNWRIVLQRSSVRAQQNWALWPSGHDISTTVMHRCCPCHSGWKSWTAGLAYVQTPVLCLFKYILRGICVLKTVNLLCATTVFWSGRKIILWDPSILAGWLCPGDPYRWPLSSVRGWTSSPVHTWHWLYLLPEMLSPWWGAGSVWFCNCEVLQLV